MAEYIENVLAQTSKLDWAFPFERKGGFPLDKSALFSSLEDAQKYATGKADDERKLGGTSYVGQIISVYEPAVEANEDEGIEAKAASVSAFIITPARGLVKLAATTASGDVAGDIADLQGKVTAILGDIEALEQAIGNVYTKSEVDALVAGAKDDRVDGLVESVGTLEENLGKEAERAAAAEKALGERIDGIDFVDETELATALEPYAKTADVNTALADYAKTSDVETALAGYTTTEGLNTLLEGKVDKSTYATDKEALEGEDAAIRAIAEDAQSKIDTFLEGTDTDDVVNKLKEIQEELEKLGDAVELEEQFAAKADKTYVDEELAKKQDVIAENTYDAYGSAAQALSDAIDYADSLAGNYDDYGAAIQALNEAKEYAESLGQNYDAAGSAAKALEDAKNDAADRVSNLKDYADETFATKAYVGTIPTSYAEQKTIIEYVNKKAEETLAAAQGGSSETAASVKLQLDNYKTENEPKFEKLEGIAAGAQVNVLEGVKVNGTELAITDKKVNIDLTPYAKQADLETVSTQANKGVSDAAGALAAAQAAQGTADTNAGNITTLQNRMKSAEDTIAEQATAIATHATEYATLKGRVDGHDEAIAARALASQVYTKDEVNAITGTPAEGKTLVGMINDKANAADVYAKTEVYTKSEVNSAIKVVTDSIGAVPANSTVMAEIAKAQAAATYDDEEVRGLISGNTTAIEAIAKDYLKAADKTELSNAIALKADATALAAEVKDREDGDAAINTEIGKINSALAALGEVDSETAESIKSLASWVETHGAEASEMADGIETNAAAIKVINETTIPAAIQTAKDYADAQITALDLANTYEEKGAAATALTEAKGYTDAQIPAALASYKVKEVVSGHDALTVSTDENGKVTIGFASEIVLNGGSASIGA